ncbi:hypothetical protein NGA_0248902 [Nannochloropsis gaditana CCMP526]|uniref:uncharacterized protein n=1 Tax=Nannochloropsis gaditana (strain CCMP526) TaxID=1093141 RepID=UPI00029F5BEF|nr:hypothetical protein NGA_0248902 [Nannochloropsis gaditana CCMP526]XP_005856149.1 hypothetical protein NGA_0248901 [Nannochloropsis gaditana CCMP526]EKU20217.1 hypothetical protein NGA_0248901 [Nannochloropsis gaditana CCMP526]EKU20857.1 hypothetical protein NGA_0248902 [Nannochloropsis gaditana CCMP526]|eukprot:XP_005855499.1 hypothetical protein NGA_0248902 [Nannochloropsis gaditana CCMP526]
MPYPCFRRISIFVSFMYLSFLFLIPSVYALYEEDAGKFDWHKSLLGPVCHARFEGNFLLLASSYGAVAVASASNSDGSLLWRQVIPLAAPVALPVRDGGTMDKDEKPAVKVLELVLHPQKRLVMALTRDPSTAALGVWAWRLFDGNLMWHVTVPASGVPLGKRVKAKEGGFLALFPDTVGAVDGETGEIYFLSAVDGTRIWKAPAIELMAVTGVVPVDGGTEKGVVVVGEGSDGKAQAFLVRLGGEKAEKIKSVSFSDGGLISHGTPSLHAFARPAPARSLALLLLSPSSSSSLSAADMQLVNPSGAKATPHGVLSSPIPSSHPSSLSASCLVLSDSGAVVEITLTQGKFMQRLVAPPSSPSLPLAFRAGPYVLRGEENQGPGVEVFRVVDGQSVGRVRGRRSLRGLWAGIRGGWREEEKEGRESDLLVLTVDKAETLVLQTMDDRLVWLREECLADVAQVLIVDHRPPAEGEKRSGTEDVTEALATSPLFEKLLSVVLPPSPSSSSVRDPHFGLTKILLFLCAPSSRLIALLSSHGGTILWTRDLSSVEGREGARWRMVQQGDEVLLVGEGGEGLAIWS